MPSLTRLIKTNLWDGQQYFRKLSYMQKYLYLFLLTCPMSSETSVFPFPLENQCLPLRISFKQLVKTFDSLIERGLILYDAEYEEVLVLRYFENHPPSGGLTYEMFKNDFLAIKSEMLIDHLVEISKNYKISQAFFAALADRRPELEEPDQMAAFSFSDKKIKPLDEVRSYAQNGRDNRS